jgi:cellulose synthase/poly-beta-1,6-N-acetylglucosamine synthase-like glycosyltransferase
MLAEILFWISLGAVLHTYFVYPAMMGLLVRIRRPQAAPDPPPALPRMSVVVSVYNEESILPEKLKNLETLDYPHDRIEFLFGSDGSTDRSDEILKNASLPGLHHYSFAQRRGKVAVVNDLVSRARGEIIVFSDANTMYRPDTIRSLTAQFADPRVGGVCGELLIQARATTAAGESEGSYWSYETYLKRWESIYQTILGGTGGVYAIRRELFRPLPTHKPVVDDFLIPLEVVRQGYRMVYEPGATAYEEATDSMGKEFRRRVRIGAQNFSGIPEFADLLHPRHGFVAFALWSHKVLRWCVPFFAAIMLATSALLAAMWSLYFWILVGELAILASAFIGWAAERVRIHLGIFSMPYYVVAMNIALFVGFLKFVAGRQRTTWDIIR